MRPSRRAHGADHELVEVEEVHRGLRDHRASHHLLGPALGHAGDAAALHGRHRGQARDDLAHVVTAAGPGARGRPRSTGRPRRSGPAAGTVLDVATARRGSPTRRSRPATSAIRARACRRTSRTDSGVGGSPMRKSRVETSRRRAAPTPPRRAPRRCPTPARGSATDVEHGCARSTTRTSDAPRGRSCGPRPRPTGPRCRAPSPHAPDASTCSPLVASRIADVAKAITSVAPLSSASRCPGHDEVDQLVDGHVVDPAVGVEVLGQPQRHLELRRGHRRSAVVRVDEQQVDRVGSEVENAQSHATKLSAVRTAQHSSPPQ